MPYYAMWTKVDFMKNSRFEVEGRQFRTQTDYQRALRDKKLIDTLRKETASYNTEKLKQLVAKLKSPKSPFLTVLGQDYIEELESRIRGYDKAVSTKQETLDSIVMEQLKKQDKRRRFMILFCSVLGIVCLSYFGIYMYRDYKVKSTNEQLNQLKEKQIKVQKL